MTTYTVEGTEISVDFNSKEGVFEVKAYLAFETQEEVDSRAQKAIELYNVPTCCRDSVIIKYCWASKCKVTIAASKILEKAGISIASGELGRLNENSIRLLAEFVLKNTTVIDVKLS